jgi:hypothetical protein
VGVGIFFYVFSVFPAFPAFLGGGGGVYSKQSEHKGSRRRETGGGEGGELKEGGGGDASAARSVDASAAVRLQHLQHLQGAYFRVLGFLACGGGRRSGVVDSPTFLSLLPVDGNAFRFLAVIRTSLECLG